MATADELRAELARVESSTAVEGDVVTPPSNGLVLIIKGEEFECRRVGTSWQMMQFSKAQQAASLSVPRDLGHDKDCKCAHCKRRTELEERRNAAGMKMLSALYDTAMVLLKPAERERFMSFMDEQGLTEEGIDNGELEQAIGNVIAAAGGEEPGKADTATSQPSSRSSTNTNTTVARVSSDKATDGVSVTDVI